MEQINFVREDKYFEIIVEINGTENGRQVLRHTDILNEKSGSLLTHVSIMIAVVGFAILVPVELGHAQWIEAALKAEMFLYILVSMGCLRSSFLTSYWSFSHKQELSYLEQMIRIVRRRRRTHNAMNKFTVLLTAIFMITVGFKFAYGIYEGII